MNVNFRVAKSMFFDREVTRGLSAAARRVLSKYGAFVRRAAKSSLKRARQKKVSELTPEERQSYDARKALAKRKGEKPPRRPEVTSKPGRPPLLHTRPKSPLRETIYFIYDPNEKAVLIGPMATPHTGGEATEALEHGGTSLAKTRGGRRSVRVAAHPFMAPAAERERAHLLKWRNTVR